MARLRTPESDDGRISTLTKAITIGPSDRAAGREYISQALIASIAALLNDQSSQSPGDLGVPGYTTRVRILTAKRAKLMKETGEAATAWETVEHWVRDFWEVLKRRTSRLKHDHSVLAYFKLPEDGSLPELNNREDVENACQSVIDGEAAAVAASFPPMANPSAAEVAFRQADARRETGEVTAPTREVEGALRDVQEVRPKAIELVDDLAAELRFNLRRMEPGAARDIMRSYGFMFEFDPGETPDPVPAPTPAPTPAPMPPPPPPAP